MKITLNDGSSYNRNIKIKPINGIILGKKLLDLRTVANSVFLLEDEIHANKKIAEVEIPLFGNYPEKVNLEIQELLEFLFSKSIKISFSNKGIQKQIEYGGDSFSNNYTCLFSGGLDSFSGILNADIKYKNVPGVYTRHEDFRNTTGFIKKLEREVLSKYNSKITVVPSEKNKDYTRITRGFLYVSNGLLLRNRNVIIAEVGPTMFQPKFALLDQITFTTHPKVMALSKSIAQGILSTRIKLIKPNEDLTKAEVAVVSPEKKYIPITCSCLTTRFCNSSTPNGDRCYGCIIRRLALIVAGVKDSQYRIDVLTKRKNNADQYDNVLHLLNFALDILTEFDDLESYTKGIITEYKKKALFERFALDVFAGLYLLNRSGKLRDRNFKQFLRRGLQSISAEKLQNRVMEVRERKFKPDFNNLI